MPTVANSPDREPGCLETRFDELLAAVTGLHELLKQLLELATSKLAAMRAADTDALQRCAANESAVLQRLFEQEKERDAAIARLAQGLPPGGTGPPRLSELAQRLGEPFSSRLRAKTAGLREVATALQEKNRLAAAVARNLHTHICAVFDDVAKVNQESVVYGPSGKHEQRSKRTWVDAVG